MMSVNNNEIAEYEDGHEEEPKIECMRNERTGRMSTNENCMYRPKQLLVDNFLDRGSKCVDYEQICKVEEDGDVNKTLLQFRPI